MGLLDSIQQFHRLQSIFGNTEGIPPTPLGGMTPQPTAAQGGITGNMPLPQSPMSPMAPTQGAMSGEIMPAGGPPKPQAGQTPLTLEGITGNFETRGQDKMYEMLDQMPTRNKPGKGRKIAGILAGIAGGGPQAYEDIAYAPYHKQVADYNQKFGIVKDVAGIEENNNSNLRSVAGNLLTSERANADRLSREQIAAKKLELDQAKLKLANFKAQNPNYIFKTSEGGEIVAFKPNDPTSYIKTGINSGEMDEMDRLQFQLQGRLTAMEEQQANAIALENLRTRNDRSLLRDSIAGRIEVNNADPNRTGNNAESPQEKRVRLFGLANQLKNTKPEWAPFIQLGSPGSNDFELVAPTRSYLGRMWNPDSPEHTKRLADFEALKKAIYGDETQTQTPTNTSGNQTQPQAPKAPAGWKYVPKPGGGWTAVEDK
jgi:hypothetical protein